MQTNFKAFISYSHANEKQAKWLHKKLESYRPPRKLTDGANRQDNIPSKLTPIFRDRDDLSTSHDLSSRIGDALQSSENLIVICSEQAVASRWVNQEIELFQKLGKGHRIFCLCVDNDDAAAENPEAVFPPAVSDIYDDAGLKQPGRREPLAADMSRDADGPNLAFLKIASGLLDVPLDQLRQRELQRKQRQLAAVIISALCVVAITSALAVNATLARNQANLRQQQAEALLGFLVGELRDKLVPIGRLDVLEDVGQRAKDYFATVDIDDLSDEELLQQSQVMTQLGEISLAQLNFPQAISAFRQAYERSAALTRAQPKDGKRLFNRAQSEYWIGYVYWREGTLDAAYDWFNRYLESSKTLSALAPDRDDWLIEVAYGYHNLAALDESVGNLESASTGFARVTEVYRNLIQRNPDADYARDLADNVSWQGKIALRKGELSLALTHYQASTAQIRALSVAEPTDAGLQQMLADSLHLIADVASISGKIVIAQDANVESVKIYGQLLQLDSSNTEWKLRSIKAALMGAALLASDNNTLAASESLEEVMPQLEAIPINERSERAIDTAFTKAYMLRHWLEQSSGELYSAMTAAESALLSAEAELARGTSDQEQIGGVALALIALGETQRSLGLDIETKASFTRAEELLRSAMTPTSTYVLLDPWARLRFHQGNLEEATSAADELKSRGYQPLRTLLPLQQP